LSLPRPSGGTYSVVAAPFRPRSPAGVTPAAAVMLVVNDPTASREPLAGHLRRAYGLTAAETKLTLALLEGKNLHEIAAERRTALSTVRVQVKTVLHKTGARRQAELVARLLASPAAWLNPPAGEGRSGAATG
jgi:DNA-binding CsgD family transcriptional regulator